MPGGFLVFGGTRWGLGDWAPGRDEVLGDTWLFDAASASWRELTPAGLPGAAVSPAPPPRVFHAMAALEGGRVVMAGGSSTIPGVTCLSDAWVLELPSVGGGGGGAAADGYGGALRDGAAWRPLPQLPAGLYHGSLVGSRGEAFAFGGHLCTTGGVRGLPYSYTNAAWRIVV